MRMAWLSLALASALVMSVPAQAQSVPAPAFTVLPPPGLNDPGPVARPASTPAPVSPAVPASRPQSRTRPLRLTVPAAAPPQAAARTVPASGSTAIPIPSLPSLRTPPAAGPTAPAPTVTVTRHDGDVIEQYYEGGQLYMVRVHPRVGTTYTYMVHKGHQLDRGPGAPPVSPVLFTVLKWGQPPAPADQH